MMMSNVQLKRMDRPVDQLMTNPFSILRSNNRDGCPSWARLDDYA